MVDDEVKQKVRKFLQDEGYDTTVADRVLGGSQTPNRAAVAKEVMKELIRASVSGQLLVRLDHEEISRLAYAQADAMIMREAWSVH